MLQEHAAIISEEFNVTKRHAAAVLKLVDDGATVPFVARYRKEATGAMDETLLRNIVKRHEALTELDKRREFMIDSMDRQRVLTPELEKRIMETLDPVVLEDIYQPYRQKRRSRATIAREAGLQGLADHFRKQDFHSAYTCALPYVKGSVESADHAILGAIDILAEYISDSEKGRGIVRSKFQRSGQITSKYVKGWDSKYREDNKGRDPKEVEREIHDKERLYSNYFDFVEPVRSCNSHRYLAIRRGEEEGVLKVNIVIDDNEMIERLSRMFIKSTASPEAVTLMHKAVSDGYKRLMRPSIENEIAAALKDRSDDAAIGIFADNLSQMLMTPPLIAKRIMAIDPGFRSGCKLVCMDPQGNVMASEVIYPDGDFYGAAEVINFMVDRYGIDIIAIGNGTAGRECERFIQSLQLPRKLQVVMVSEQGASVYSASEEAIREFPNLDVTLRGAVSIGRRLLDPLSELVKIDPKSLGVGQYQHDVNQTKLRDALDFTVSRCVNRVGVNLNTASAKLLAYVSGIGPALADNIVTYRSENGPFESRTELMKVPRMGEKTFQQCAGFLRIPKAVNVLDSAGIHPESYPLVEKIAADNNCDVERLARDKSLLHSIDLEQYATRKVGMPTLTDIILELEKPGRDPREKAETATHYDENVRKIDDLHIGQELTGKVNNITSFGVFVDLGLKENGLVHISQLSDDYVSNASDVVRMGQVITVKVLDVDPSRGRIVLTMRGLSRK